jgi:hypothetical protein
LLIAVSPALAQVPGASASFSGPTPNPVPAGTTATVSAQFSLAADVGPIAVAIQLQGAGADGVLRLDAANTTAQLQNCAVNGAEASCDWAGLVADGPQTLAVFVDIAAATQPGSGWNLQAVVGSPTTGQQNLANTNLFVSPPTGNTTLSGSVVTTGNVPVASACIFVLSSPSFVFSAITDGAGNWSLGGLPDSYQFAIGVVPPFNGTNGPCANNGPPPVPGPGELQPVFVGDGWIDLSDPALVGGTGDPFTYAVARGATVFTGTTGGIQACLTSAPGNVVPRPSCNQVTPTTTTPPPSTVTPTTDPGTSPTSAAPTTILRLPPVGTATLPLGLAAVTLIAAGAITLVAVRQPKRKTSETSRSASPRHR